jgi:hypothetical protein
MKSYYQIGWEQKAGELTQQLLDDTLGVPAAGGSRPLPRPRPFCRAR